MALLSVFDLGLASAVLLATGAAAPLVLFAWVALLAIFAGRYLSRRWAWTRERLTLTTQLLASMVGHRTRVTQQAALDQHVAEDESLARYVRESRAYDRSSLWVAAAPRGWFVLAIAAMTPAFVRGATPTEMALGVGGLLLAYRALERASTGLASVSGAAIAARIVAPLVRAGAHAETSSPPSMVVAGDARQTAPADPVVAQAREVTFSYRAGDRPVLDGCSLQIARGARVRTRGSVR